MRWVLSLSSLFFFIVGVGKSFLLKFFSPGSENEFFLSERGTAFPPFSLTHPCRSASSLDRPPFDVSRPCLLERVPMVVPCDRGSQISPSVGDVSFSDLLPPLFQLFFSPPLSTSIASSPPHMFFSLHHSGQGGADSSFSLLLPLAPHSFFSLKHFLHRLPMVRVYDFQEGLGRRPFYGSFPFPQACDRNHPLLETLMGFSPVSGGLAASPSPDHFGFFPR